MSNDTKPITRHKIGWNLQRARERAMLTQKQAGERTCLGRSMIKAIESGKRRSIDPDMLQTLADCYGVDVQDFFRE